MNDKKDEYSQKNEYKRSQKYSKCSIDERKLPFTKYKNVMHTNLEKCITVTHVCRSYFRITMAKRGGSELNHENWDQDAEPESAGIFKKVEMFEKSTLC